LREKPVRANRFVCASHLGFVVLVLSETVLVLVIEAIVTEYLFGCA
jgi:hypothetical protein